MANIANIIGKLTSINTSLGEIKNAIVGGSNTDYDNLTNKPQINSVTLSGNKTSGDLGLVASSSVGVASGVAELDNTGHVPSSQLPSYVDDVVEGYYNNVTDKFYSDNAYTTEIPGETGKIYITLDTNLSYRYTGSGFVVVSPSLALGETSSTAYRGDRGKIAYDTSQSNSTAIGNINTALGNTSISGIGDGSVTGAISSIDGDVNTIETALGNTSISGVGDGTVTGAISTLNNSIDTLNSSKSNKFIHVLIGSFSADYNDQTWVVTGYSSNDYWLLGILVELENRQILASTYITDIEYQYQNMRIARTSAAAYGGANVWGIFCKK